MKNKVNRLTVNESTGELLIMPKAWNQLNSKYRPKKQTLADVTKRVSLTIPDQTMSIRTLIDRHSRGLPLSGVRESIYEEEDNPTSGINPKTLDLTDYEKLTDDYKKNLLEYEEAHKKQTRLKSQARENEIKRLAFEEGRTKAIQKDE